MGLRSVFVPSLSRKMMLFRQIMTVGLKPLIVPAMIGTSGSFMYPFIGMVYFITHPKLWAYMITILLPHLVITLMVFTLMYMFLYPPQALVALLFNGPSGIITAFIALIQECMVATHLVSSWFLLPTPLKYLFDTVMSMEGHDDLVVKGKLRKSVKVPLTSRARRCIIKLPGKILWPKWVLRCIVIILLNFVPVIGPLILILVEAPRKGRESHERYFDLKGFDERQSKAIYDSKKSEYVGFGLISGALESCPVIGTLFQFSNTTGAALWACSMERNLAKVSGQRLMRRK